MNERHPTSFKLAFLIGIFHTIISFFFCFNGFFVEIGLYLLLCTPITIMVLWTLFDEVFE